MHWNFCTFILREKNYKKFSMQIFWSRSFLLLWTVNTAKVSFQVRVIFKISFDTSSEVTTIYKVLWMDGRERERAQNLFVTTAANAGLYPSLMAHTIFFNLKWVKWIDMKLRFHPSLEISFSHSLPHTLPSSFSLSLTHSCSLAYQHVYSFSNIICQLYVFSWKNKIERERER